MILNWLAGANAGDWNAWELVWLYRPGLFEALLMGAGLLAILALAAYGLRREKRRRVRLLIWGLRAFALVLLLTLWLHPAIQLQKRLDKKSTLVILADASRSMSLPAGPEGSRYELQRRFLSDNRPALDSLGQRYALRTQAFERGVSSRSLSALSDAKAVPTGEFTSLFTALKGALNETPEGELAGVLLISDGLPNPPPGIEPAANEILAAYKARGVPIHTFIPGREGALRDLAIADLRSDGFAFVRNKLTIEAEIKSTGYAPRLVSIALRDGERLIAEKSVQVPAQAAAKVEFTFTPERVGRFLYRLQIPVDSDDAVPANNTRAFMVDVLRDKIRALLVSGHPDYDEQFMRRFLKNNPNVDLVSFFILRTPSDLSAVNENELSLIPFPTDELFDKQLHTFDLLVFQNFTYRGYQMEQYLGNVQRYVLQGGALLMIGGDISFGAGGYAHTPIEDILPLTLDTTGPAFDAEPFAPVFAPDALDHPILQVTTSREGSEAAFAAAAPLWGLNLGLVPRPDARVLATHPRLKNRLGQPAPVIVARTAGEGRVLAVAADSTWRWAFSDKGANDLYHRFYTNALRWLMKDPELTHLTLKTEPETVAPGAELRLDLRLTDPSFAPQSAAPITLLVTPADSDKPLVTKDLVSDEAGAASYSFKVPEQTTTLKITAFPKDRPQEREERLVAIGGASGELDEVGLNRPLMQEIADTTGGTLHELPTTLDPDDLKLATRTQAHLAKKRDIPLWDNALTLGLLTALLLTEWWTRKRRRLP